MNTQTNAVYQCIWNAHFEAWVKRSRVDKILQGIYT